MWVLRKGEDGGVCIKFVVCAFGRHFEAVALCVVSPPPMLHAAGKRSAVAVACASLINEAPKCCMQFLKLGIYHLGEMHEKRKREISFNFRYSIAIILKGILLT